MGDVTVTVTGAAGFVGRACVAEARRMGLPVVALYRSQILPEWETDPGVTPLKLDLTAPGSTDLLAGNLVPGGALIHAAAHLGDDPQALLRDTLDATRTVMAAKTKAEQRLVLISSLAVYDTEQLAPGDSVTEGSPLIPLPQNADPQTILATARDAYAGAKRVQEALLIDDDASEDDWVLRPGAIWGPGRSWHALQGFWASKLFVTIGSEGQLPLAHVDTVARTAVEAARRHAGGVSVVNIFDSDLPTRSRFLRAHRAQYGWPRLNLTIHYGLWSALVAGLRPVARHLPGLFQGPVLRARMMPLRFPNDRMRQAFGAPPEQDFDTMMRQTREAE